jgi:hypothetical protein
MVPGARQLQRQQSGAGARELGVGTKTSGAYPVIAPAPSRSGEIR